MVSQADKIEHTKIKRQLKHGQRKLEEMGSELARDGMAVGENDEGRTCFWVFDTKSRRWILPPDDFSVDAWRKNWRKRKLGTPKIPPPRQDAFLRLGLPDFTSEPRGR